MTDAKPTQIGPQPRTWRTRRAWAVLLTTIILGLAADLVSKELAFRHIADRPVHVERGEVLSVGPNNLGSLLPAVEPHTVVPNILDLTLVLNPGAVFGIGAGQRGFFILFTVVAIGFGFWMFASWTRHQDAIAHAAIGLLLAGGLGNLYDRLMFACVRDFLHPLPGVVLPYGWRWPIGGGREIWPYVSNVADLLLLIGIAVLMVYIWRRGGADRAARPQAEPRD